MIDQNDQKSFQGIISVQLLFNGVLVSDTAIDSNDCNPLLGAIPNPSRPRQMRACLRLLWPRPARHRSTSTPSSRWTPRTPAFLFAVNTRYYLQTGQLHLGLNIISVQART